MFIKPVINQNSPKFTLACSNSVISGSFDRFRSPISEGTGDVGRSGPHTLQNSADEYVRTPKATPRLLCWSELEAEYTN
jgi:hypothetical protein